jgi:putative MATE family efflux protein
MEKMDLPARSPEATSTEATTTPANPAADKLAHAPVGRLLLTYSLPAIIANSVAALYNITDRIFIGHGVGPIAIAGLALSFPVMLLAAAFGAMVGIGSSALTSIRMGEGKSDEVPRVLGNAVLLNVIFGVAYSLVAYIFLDKILYSMGASPAMLAPARQFLSIILIFNTLTEVYLGLNHLIRASGFPRKAMVNMLMTVGINLALCPLFIFVFGWGIRGAAIATIGAQATGVALTLAHFCSPKHPIRFRKGCFRPHMPTIRAILSIGVANFAMLFCASFVNAFYNFGLSRYGGDYAVAAFGIANTIGALLVMVIMGISIGIQPVAGFNFGARSFSRVREAVRYALLAAVGVATLGFVMAQALPRVLAHAFTTDSRLIEETVASMPLLFAVFPVVGFQIVISSLFQSIGKAKVSVVLGLSRQCLFLLPALAILPRFFGLRGVWCAAPVTDLLSALLAAVAYKKMLPRYLNQEDEI